MRFWENFWSHWCRKRTFFFIFRFIKVLISNTFIGFTFISSFRCSYICCSCWTRSRRDPIVWVDSRGIQKLLLFRLLNFHVQARLPSSCLVMIFLLNKIYWSHTLSSFLAYLDCLTADSSKSKPDEKSQPDL